MGNICWKEDEEVRERLGVFERKVVDKHLLMLEVQFGTVDFDRKILINTMYDSSRKIKSIHENVEEIRNSNFFFQKKAIKESLTSIKSDLYILTDLSTNLASDYQKSLIKSKKLIKILRKNISKMVDKTEILIKSESQADLCKVMNMRIATLKKQLVLLTRKAWLLKSRVKPTPRPKLSRYSSCPVDLVTNLKTEISRANTLFAKGKEKKILVFPQSCRNISWNSNQFTTFVGGEIDTCATLSDDKRSDDVGMNKTKMSLAAQMLYEETIEIKRQINSRDW
jgi:hypothetical protein